ncbi:hypothetical protein PILCRDRAFT_711973 [Piloderma croceum F 1598]|uniref:Uncharacterized protein n=1 Tax=Piloderma croceum (strain F 1598) TaxID=765440 RepID=A0A0C3AJV3_PILCF|nr:hypothetical protein PILCRDRAFT_711973 [Piloderma croceum F 1598]
MICAPEASCLIKSKDPRLRIDAYAVADSAAVTVTTRSYLLCLYQSWRMVAYSTSETDKDEHGNGKLSCTCSTESTLGWSSESHIIMNP